MVFVPSTKVGEELQASLQTLGLEVPLYHSRLENAWERQELVKRFLGQSRQFRLSWAIASIAALTFLSGLVVALVMRDLCVSRLPVGLDPSSKQAR